MQAGLPLRGFEVVRLIRDGIRTPGSLFWQLSAIGAVENQASRFVRDIPLREVPAVLEPMQPRIGKYLQCSMRLAGEAHTVAASPSDYKRMLYGIQRCTLLHLPVSKLVQKFVEGRGSGEATHLCEGHFGRQLPGMRRKLREEQRPTDRIPRNKRHDGLQEADEANRRINRRIKSVPLPAAPEAAGV